MTGRNMISEQELIGINDLIDKLDALEHAMDTLKAARDNDHRSLQVAIHNTTAGVSDMFNVIQLDERERSEVWDLVHSLLAQRHALVRTQLRHTKFDMDSRIEYIP